LPLHRFTSDSISTQDIPGNTSELISSLKFQFRKIQIRDDAVIR
jgi:hypothetical protein